MSQTARRRLIFGLSLVIVWVAAFLALSNLASLAGLVQGNRQTAPVGAVTLPAKPAAQPATPAPNTPSPQPDAFAAAGFENTGRSAEGSRVLRPLIRHLAAGSTRAGARQKVEQALGTIPRQRLQAYTHPGLPGFVLYAQEGEPVLASFQPVAQKDQRPARTIFLNVRRATPWQLADPAYLADVTSLARGEKPGAVLAIANPPGWAMVGTRPLS